MDAHTNTGGVGVNGQCDSTLEACPECGAVPELITPFHASPTSPVLVGCWECHSFKLKSDWSDWAKREEVKNGKPTPKDQRLP